MCSKSKGLGVTVTPVAQWKRVGLLIQRLWVRVPSGVEQFLFFSPKKHNDVIYRGIIII